MQSNIQAPGTVLMIRPSNFGYNPETSGSNAFQRKDEADPETIRHSAVKEFNNLVAKLKKTGIEVIVIDDTENPVTPDAVFPNNWISTHNDGKIILYPMLAPSRRKERRGDILVALQTRFNFNVRDIQDLCAFEESNLFLEGTGSIVFDYPNRKGYANLSSRTHLTVLNETCDILEIDPVVFTAKDRQGLDIYHTNVVMSIGEQFAVICMEVIPEETERKMIRESLETTGHEIIEISYEQMLSFAGNMIELKGKNEQSILVMSDSAFGSLSAEQRLKLEQYTKLLHSDLNTIEKYGGGSARCMIAGIYLPKLSE